jgi:glucose/arabinose dehydrogenase
MPAPFECLRAILLAATLALLAACGGGGGASGSPDNPPVDGATGMLSLTLSGLPPALDAAVVVTGPAGFSQALAATSVLADLAPGVYTVTASSVLAGSTAYTPQPGTQSVTVGAGALASAAVTYASAGGLRLGLQEVASGLASPLFLTAPAADARLFIVERPGRVRILRGGALLPTPFLDISARVSTAGEGGLLSIAFHPQYAANGFFFAYFTDPGGDIAIERFQVSAGNPDVATAAGLRILTIAHRSFTNHKGGLVAFGPDGYLYLGTGDGGGGGDPLGNGQDLGALLGKLLRIDVSNATASEPYAIPPTNPFAGQAGRRGEIWANGLRNPWRYAFDAATGLLYIADVGQDRVEEVNVVPAASAGLNYGWNLTEGSLCYPGEPCNKQGITLPVLEYAHDGAGGCSITGGRVYRGAALPELRGRYFYSDYCSGWLRSFLYAGGNAGEQVDWGIAGVGQVLSFGEDASGELYLLAASGRVYRIVRQ